MSGHSKWSTIKRQKSLNDQARGKLFSKLGRALSAAVSSGGPNPDSNLKLRMAIDQARAANMPKDNIERSIQNAAAKSENLTDVTYEGFGPDGVNIIIEATTDNRNRTAQEVKSTLERGGGSLGGPGSVAHNFETVGLLFVEKGSDPESQILGLIDYGVTDVNIVEEGIEAYVPFQTLYDVKQKVEEAGMAVQSADVIHKPLTEIPLDDRKSETVYKLVESLEDLDDVMSVSTNLLAQ